MVGRRRDRIAVFTRREDIEAWADDNTPLCSSISRPITGRQRNAPTSQRFIGLNTSHNAPGARLDSQPAPVNRAQGRDVIRVDTQCAIQIVLTPSRSAEDLVRIVRAALA